MKFFVFCLLLIAISSAANLFHVGVPNENVTPARVFYDTSEKAIQYYWTKYQATFNRTYGAEEETTRFANFIESVHRINQRNRLAQENGWSTTYHLNKFSDMSQEEFKNTMLMPPRAPRTPRPDEGFLELPQTFAAPPASFDWRPRGAVTAVKNQGQCGSCWAFSTVENVESVNILAGRGKNNTLILSEQQVVDCDQSDAGCGGGDPPTAYEYIMQAGGLESEKVYPYHAVNQQCQFNKKDVVVSISNWKWATEVRSESAVQNALVNWSPLSICLDASNWSDYSGGVMTSWECAWFNVLDHCVQLVGYDTTASSPYWMVRNSWGTDWGINGYIRLEYGSNTCGMLNEVTSSVA